MRISASSSLIANVKVVYFGSLLVDLIGDELGEVINNIQYVQDFDGYMKSQTLMSLPEVILIEVDGNEQSFDQVIFIKSHPLMQGLIVVLIGVSENREWRKKSLKLKVDDYYEYPLPMEDFTNRINFLVKFKSVKTKISDLPLIVEHEYQMPVSKRVFDVIVSSFVLLFLSPLFLVIAILIKLESKGPIIYKSKRVGAGYKIFDFYKFRSMRSDADTMIAQLSDLNQYASNTDNGKTAFVKFANDPRITKLGRLLRKTSIDELPQLINVVIGDMSLVGNRPLPLYEAEQLTTDRWSTRFIGPAGLTGLWQTSRRGKKEMSESERKELDNYYANHYSILLDFKIILKTIPALIQKEDV